MPRKLLRSLMVGVLLAVLLIFSACQELPPQLSMPMAQQTPSPAPSTTVVMPIAPKVSQPELLRHLEALSFERHTDRDRQQARDYLTQALKSYGWQTQTQAFGKSGVNLIATRPGADPTAQKILVVAHYDSFLGSPGADDNATGVAAALEIARLFATSTTRRTLEIVFFDQEERGLLGSIAFTAQADRVKAIAGVINLEMIGYTCNQPGCQKYPEGIPVSMLSDRGDFLAVVGDQEHPELLQAFANLPNQPFVLTVPIPYKGLLTPDVLRSDHAPFWAQNIGAVMVTDTSYLRNPHYHRATDTADTINPTFFSGSAQQVVQALTRLLSQG